MANYKNKKCVICGSVYIPTSPKQKSCINKECRSEVRRQADRKRYKKNNVEEEKRCPVCSYYFYTTDTRRIYCSNHCYREGRKNRSSAMYKKIKVFFELLGYTLVSNTYTNNRTKLDYICPSGHVNSMSWSNFKSGKRCPDCYGNKKHTIDYIRERFAEEKYTLVSTAYDNGYSKLSYICPNGHTNKMSWNNFRSGRRCPECFGISRLTIKKVKERFEKESYILLSDEYVDNVTELRYICPEGHQNTTTWSRFDSAGKRCPDCAGNKKLSIHYIGERFNERGYNLLSKEYINNKTNLRYICPVGHDGTITWDNFYNKGKGCLKCSCSKQTSEAENEIYSFVCSMMGKERVLSNDRVVISPYELDIFIPEKNLAIEYCGLYWHSEVSGCKTRRYHYNKMKACNDKGIRLITVFEDEYRDRPKQVLSRIQNALGVVSEKVYARKCNVVELSSKEAGSFLEEHHLQGKTISSKRWGLIFNSTLVSVMTVGKMSRAHTSRLKGCPEAKVLELKRFANRTGISVVGGASRLFKRVKQYAAVEGFTHVKSYCDMRYGNHRAPVYEKLGFSFLTYTKYTPHYVKQGKRFRNQRLRKTPEERLTGKTEWELRQEQGYDRIWDCGHNTYIFKV